MTQPSTPIVPSGALENKPPERTVGKQYQPLALVLLVTAFVLGGIGSRLAYLQIYEGDRNRSLAESNRIRLVPQAPERGKLLDSRGRILADNRLAFSLAAWPSARSPQEWRSLVPTLARTLDVPQAELYQRIDSAGYRSMELVHLARDITPQQMTALVELQSAEEGIEIIKESARVYPYGDLAQSTVGRVQEAQTRDIPADRSNGIRVGDWLGINGLEAALNPRLTGSWGIRQVELSEEPGAMPRPLAGQNAQAGETIRLTLDARIQQTAETLLGDRTGALVVLHGETGKVMALVSNQGPQRSETANMTAEIALTNAPNASIDSIDRALERGQERGDVGQTRGETPQQVPHLALQGQLPGSLFELVTATAALESGTIAPNRRLRVRPWKRVGGVRFGDRYRSASTFLSLRAALERQDPLLSEALFEDLALTLGTGEAITWARKLGLGQRTGIELQREEVMPLPLEQLWKRESEQERWFVGDGVNLALGQGELRVSPLQMAVFVGLLVNGGYRVQPHLVDGATAATPRQFVGLKPNTVRTLQQGFKVAPLAIATAKANATAPTNASSDSPADASEADSAGFQSTLAGRSSTISYPNGDRWHWFAAYAPAQAPQYVAVAIVADGTADGIANGTAAAPQSNGLPGSRLAEQLVQTGLWESLDPSGSRRKLVPRLPKIDSPPLVNTLITDPSPPSTP
ncbi:MAG: penicillin-binding transpeptidase domain-containing protein [Cyanobacteria bacterium P01_H01_bin.130]